MDGIITREELARDYAEFQEYDCERLGFTTGHYEQNFNEIMRLDDFEFLQLYTKFNGQKLIVIAKNRYLLDCKA